MHLETGVCIIFPLLSVISLGCCSSVHVLDKAEQSAASETCCTTSLELQALSTMATISSESCGAEKPSGNRGRLSEWSLVSSHCYTECSSFGYTRFIKIEHVILQQTSPLQIGFLWCPEWGIRWICEKQIDRLSLFIDSLLYSLSQTLCRHRSVIL